MLFLFDFVVSQVKGADTEEKVVFQIIKDAQNKGKI